MITEYPAKVTKSILNEGEKTFSLFLDISGLDGDELFEHLKTNPAIPFRKMEVHEGKQTLELITDQIPFVKQGQIVSLIFHLPVY